MGPLACHKRVFSPWGPGSAAATLTMMRLLLAVALLMGSSPASARVFQCAIPPGRTLPEIVLIGEDHCSEASARVMFAFARAASDRRLILGLENVYSGGEGDLFNDRLPYRPDHEIFGIDDGLLHGLAGAYLFGLMERGCRGDDRHTVASAAGMLRRNPRMRSAWWRLIQEDPAVASWPDAQLLHRGAQGEDIRAEDVGPVDAARRDRVGLILRKLHAKFVEDAASVGPQWRVSALPEDLSDEAAVRRARESFESVVIDARNHVMVNNLMGLYCRAAREGKPIVAVVGYMHLEGMKRLLDQESGGQAQVLLYRSDTQSQRLLTMLESFLRGRP